MPRFAGLLRVVLGAVVGLMMTTPALSAQRAVPSDVQLRIETGQSTYRVGDSITVRLAFTNQASLPIAFITFPPWGEARLVVTDAAGRVVAPPLRPAPVYLVSTHREELPGGQTHIRGWENREWFSLRMWGYAPLGPGQYTISGAPLLVVPGASADSTVRSNRVTITVAP